jgi:ubiquinone/menaquinone biosynthesis C-methylase UbiE
MEHEAEVMRRAYDRIAADYDGQWSVHVSGPQRRLTHALSIRAGERCADLGCGPGVDTLEMLELATPGEVVAVDVSGAMLEQALRRAHASGLDLTTHCEGADEFIAGAEPSSFDVITLRFCLGYLDWHSALARLPQLLRPGGRLGILTSLSSSAPQAYDTYRAMAAEFGLPAVPMTALDSIDAIDAQLRTGGARIEAAWTHAFRLEFRSGEQMAGWLQACGIATHPLLASLPPDVSRALWASFAERVERFRQDTIVPLDFELAGVIAVADQPPNT